MGKIFKNLVDYIQIALITATFDFFRLFYVCFCFDSVNFEFFVSVVF